MGESENRTEVVGNRAARFPSPKHALESGVEKKQVVNLGFYPRKELIVWRKQQRAQQEQMLLELRSWLSYSDESGEFLELLSGTKRMDGLAKDTFYEKGYLGYLG